MNVRISSYKVNLAPNIPGTVDVELEVTLPTGVIRTTVVATEASLYEAAAARHADTWAEPELVAVVSSIFRALAETVTV